MQKKLSISDRNLFEEAQNLVQKDDAPKAIIILRDLARKRPDVGIFHALLARSLREIGDLKAAELEFRMATELEPESETFSLNLFHLLWDQERYVEALDETKRFMLISDSEDYREIVKEINEKWDNGNE